MRMIRFRACCVLAAVGPVVFVSGCSNGQANSAEASRARATPAHIHTVVEETTRRRVQTVGSLFALEESTLSAEVEGRVEAVLADVGDAVKTGQPLIELDRQELQFEVDRQQGVVRQVRAQLGVGPTYPPPSDPKSLPAVQRAAADLFDAERKYGRAQEMLKDNLISQQQADEARSRYQSTKATYEVALQEVDRLK